MEEVGLCARPLVSFALAITDISLLGTGVTSARLYADLGGRGLLLGGVGLDAVGERVQLPRARLLRRPDASL